MSSRSTHFRAIASAIGGFTFFVSCDSALKLAGKSRLPNYEIVAFLGVFQAVFMAMYATLRRELSELWPTRPRRLVVRSLLDVTNNLCVVVALRHLSLTLFYILVFTSPLLVSLLSRVFLKEPLDFRRVAAILVGFLGVVVAVWPLRSSGSSSWLGVGACAICASCFSIGIVWSREIAKSERTESITFFSGVVTGAVGLAGMVYRAGAVNGWLLLLVLVASGLFGTLGNICVYAALKRTMAATVSQYHYSQLVSGAVVAWLLFRERPNAWMLAGAVLIVVAGFYVALRRDTDAQGADLSLRPAA